MWICVDNHYVKLSQYYKEEEQVVGKSTNETYRLIDAIGFNTFPPGSLVTRIRPKVQV